MAKKVWDKPIDKNIPWDGNQNTDNLPVCGYRIEEFLKGELSSRIGVLHYDTTNNKYLAFSDTVDRDAYIEDPTKLELVLASFDAPFNYTAEINLQTSAYNAVFLNSVGNYIDFTFDIKNKQGASTGENVIVTYTFIRNANKQTITETRKFSDVVHFNVDKYLGEGTNTIMIGITGQTTLAATTIAITYQVVNLTLSDELNIAQYYNISKGPQQVEIPFTVSGYGTKIVEWYIDGELLDFIKSEDEVVDVITTRTKYITISNLNQGTHSLQIRAYTIINGEKFYTDTLYRDLLVYTGTSNDIIIGVATTIPRDYGIIGPNEEVAIYEMIQYVPYTLRFATYSPLNTASTEVIVMLDDETIGTTISKNGIENEFIVTSKTSGNRTLKLISDKVTKEIVTSIKKTSMNIEEIEGAILDFNASGKSNDSPNKDIWTNGTHTGTLTGFNWTNTSGWVNGRLEMNAGSSLSIDYAPLSNNPTNTGKTIEIEWSTKNVTNDNAIICDLRGDNGVGILITATKVSMISADGVIIETEYKSDENVRIGFVINRSEGTSNRRLSFIYTNGIVSRAEQWASTDNYNSDKEISFTATNEAELSLKSIKIYNTALSSDNMLNNFILYRDTISEMMEVYDRNDVYEEGTTTFSPNKMMNRLPVMIVTGDIPVLENTSDKNEQIVVDIEYYNIQDPSRSFTMKNAAMRPQGTSSMGYPKKNFRIYTQKVANTELYDSKGTLVENKLYSFKDKAQPVNCWCLKADYAESSGTHNVGIAKLWNDALYNAQIEGEYKFRTNAQRKAIENKYDYDVRTTIDGFPILLFYRLQKNDDLIFIGKYNFNNDKSTEKVFGFTDIPGFDNSRMQCWEVLNNGNSLALFTSTEGFDDNWSEAFESRYPDTKTPYTGDLKAFCEWMTNVSPEEFATQKWEHLDVYKMAAYWIYLMRHAAADQFVKNAMLTSEDGIHFYFIHYDNDTINGLINSGYLRIKPTDGRQTIDDTGSYVFAGHDSRLWNLLEADTEFMNILSSVDNALYTAGISYNNTIKVFDEDQADKWVEKVYNQDAQYKYIGPYVEKGINNLFMLQGKRDLHRKWWLAKRFSIYDAKYVSGSYKSQAVEIKCLNGTEVGQKFIIKAGYPLDYGYGINNIPRSFGITLDIGETHEFTTQEVINIGDPLRIYGAPNIAELDFSKMSDRLAVVTIANVYDDNLGTKLTKLILGNPNKINAEVSEISGLKQAIALEELDIQGMSKMISIDLSNHQYFKRLKAFRSGLSSVSLTKGSPVELLELPSSLRTLSLKQLSSLTINNIYFEDISNLQSIEIKECLNISNNFYFIYNWYINKNSQNRVCSVFVDNIVWDNVDINEFLNLINLKIDGGTLNLKGRVSIPNATLEDIYSIRDVFGETAFYPDADFYIEVPTILGIRTETNSILEGENLQVIGEVYPIQQGNYTYSIVKNRQGCYIDSNTGYITTQETSLDTSDIIVKVDFISNNGSINLTTEKTIQVVRRTYPTYINIEGEENPADNNIYTAYVNNEGVNGNYYTEWVLTENLPDYYEIKDKFSTTAVLIEKEPPIVHVRGELIIQIKRVYDDVITYSKAFTLDAILPGIVINYIDNAPIQSLLYSKGFVANEKYSLQEEVEKITETQLQSGTSPTTSVFYAYRDSITHFEEFQYFTGVTKIPTHCFSYCTRLNSIVLPSSIKSIEARAFGVGTASSTGTRIKSIIIPEGVTYIGDEAFCTCYYLSEISLPSTLLSIGINSFYENTSLKNIIINEGCTTIKDSAFQKCSSLIQVQLPSTLNSLGTTVFLGCNKVYFNIADNNNNFKSLDGVLFNKACTTLIYYGKSSIEPEYEVPNTVTTLGQYSFDGTNITKIILPGGLKSIEKLAFYNAKYLKTIISNAVNAPSTIISTFGQTTSSYTGRNTYNTGENKLYIPLSAKGYEDNYWLNPLQDSSKCGFTIHGKLVINSNRDDASFGVVYTAEDNSLHSITLPVGVAYISDIKYDTTVTITPRTLAGYTWENTSTTITYNGATTVTLNAYIYPSSVSINGDSAIRGGDNSTYTASISPSAVDVEMTYDWSISGSLNASITASNGNSCTITTNSVEEEETCTLTCVVKSVDNKVTVQGTHTITVQTRPNFITATFNVTDVSSETAIVSTTRLSDVTYMEIDNVVVTPTAKYLFTTTGSHRVKVTTNNVANLFSGCSRLTAVDFGECDGPKMSSFNQTFYQTYNLTTITWGSCTFPNVTTLRDCFADANKLTSVNLSSFAGAKITTLANMFYRCYGLTSVNFGNIDVSNTTDISNLFYQCNKLRTITWPSTPFKNLTSLSKVFSDCKVLTNVNLAPFRECNITSLNSTFYNCNALSSINLVPLSGSAITTLDSTFYNCSSLKSIDLSPIATNALTNLGNTFRECTSLTSIDLSPFASANISSWSYAFYNCASMKTITVPWATAPSVAANTFGSGTSSYTGRNTYSTEQNILYVPVGAAGYDTNYWLDPLQDASKCGFTLSATL